MIKKTLNADLRSLNSFGIAARTAALVEWTGAEELREFLFANPEVTQGRWAVLGGGNNILFTVDFDGVLLHPVGGGIEVTGEDGRRVAVRVAAGVEWDDFVAWAAAQGLWGAENLSGIPGTVGSSPVQNVGAYGAEARDVITSVETLDPATLKELTLAGEHCGFGYRDSVFKRHLRGGAIITAVNFILSKTPRPNLEYGLLKSEVERIGEATVANIREAVLAIRSSKLPDPAVTGNAGSFFKNPVVEETVAERIRGEHSAMPSFADAGGVKIPAGWLIEQAGWKGRRVGNAGIYDRQALILVNFGDASGSDIVELARRVQADVRTMFGIDIEPEVNIW